MVHSMCDHHLPSRGVCGSPSRSDFWWWMRCSAVQKIGPPCSVIVAQMAKKYSTIFGVLYERCVWSRW